MLSQRSSGGSSTGLGCQRHSAVYGGAILGCCRHTTFHQLLALGRSPHTTTGPARECGEAFLGFFWPAPSLARRHCSRRIAGHTLRVRLYGAQGSMSHPLWDFLQDCSSSLLPPDWPLWSVTAERTETFARGCRCHDAQFLRRTLFARPHISFSLYFSYVHTL